MSDFGVKANDYKIVMTPMLDSNNDYQTIHQIITAAAVETKDDELRFTSESGDVVGIFAKGSWVSCLKKVEQ